ncbi:MFS general substrate transporter [Cutaneotrichosporon oleaginosum]|uniref:MFS general substrate transporter n=1 Tax=Cutaneotrichosporon oleaginosum TaxID=879819 RepID=A0A0J0XZE4_9TREE|nr:MFS general substrate transporter [Cutaneotrichosporon oleaginosum]KLT46408.1 MFS general substrate transporter [Cutaneotrichosporon oleaginosum]TXT15222.1 hypothetical protein COLE_01415 [Cutaneotrichosporon oleaginosum]
MTADFKDDKVVAQHTEHYDPTAKDVNNTSSGSSIDLESLDIDEKRLIRKIDYHLVPWLALLYLLSFLDRSNIGNANIFGLSEHLKLKKTPDEYGLCLAIFFVFYVLFEVPSNMVMKAWRPSMWIPTIMVAWGAVMIGMGFVTGFTSLFVTRLFLGITEAGLFPGVSFYLTQWYRKYEISWRISLFFSAATAAGAFGGLLARLINLMDGVGGYEGWRWIFILEGILTVVVAVVSFWVMYDYPGTAKFLTEPERAFVVNRLHLDNDGCSQAFKMKFVWDAFTDWKVWCAAIMFHGSLCPVYTFSLFAPTLTKNLGYTAARAQLMSVPPYVAAAFVTLSAGWISDRIQKRGIVVICCSTVGALGYGLLLANVNNGVNYFALFLAASGMYPLIPVIVAWGANNCGGALKKGVATAIIVSVGNCGGIVSSFIYPSRDAPGFKKGHAICLAYCIICIITAVIMWVYCAAANKKRAARNAARTHEWTAEEKLQFGDRGDHNDWFVYTL